MLCELHCVACKCTRDMNEAKHIDGIFMASVLLRIYVVLSTPSIVLPRLQIDAFIRAHLLLVLMLTNTLLVLYVVQCTLYICGFGHVELLT